MHDQRNYLAILIENEADLDFPAIGWDRPLHLAARAGLFDVCSLLLGEGANHLCHNAGGRTASELVAS